jgi:hypothetical protein
MKKEEVQRVKLKYHRDAFRIEGHHNEKGEIVYQTPNPKPKAREEKNETN